MAILGITNRTENWKTALYFSPLMGVRASRLAKRLLPDEEGAAIQAGDVNLELFWRGMRDYFDSEAKKLEADGEELAGRYAELFPNLRADIEAFESFAALKAHNYAVETPGQRSSLASNLFHTEIDIVLESPSHLFIGEAKHLSPLGASSDNVLTHQLIRQYVMARILVELRGTEHTVVPFVVSDGGTDVEDSSQVQFMLKRGWLREANILQWSDIEALW